MKSIFEEVNYRNYLKKQFPQAGKGRGRRLALAKFLECQTSFISLVLTERAHMSEDLIYQTGQFLELESDELKFLLLTYHHERAAKSSLKKYYRQEMQVMIAKRSQVNERVKGNHEVPMDVQAQYYSHAHYSLIHTAVLNESLRQPQEIAEQLSIPLDRVQKILQFLLEWGFIARELGEYRTGMTRLHLPGDSPFIVQHHQNWHFEAMTSLTNGNPENLSYSGVLSMSLADGPKAREILLEAVEKIEKLIAPSKDEALVGIVIDLFPCARTRKG